MDKLAVRRRETRILKSELNMELKKNHRHFGHDHMIKLLDMSPLAEIWSRDSAIGLYMLKKWLSWLLLSLNWYSCCCCALTSLILRYASRKRRKSPKMTTWGWYPGRALCPHLYPYVPTQLWAKFYSQIIIFPLFSVENIKYAHATVDSSSTHTTYVCTGHARVRLNDCPYAASRV